MFQQVAIVFVVVIILALIVTFIVTFSIQLNCPAENKESAKVTEPERDILKFLLVTDIHFDQLYDKSVSNTLLLCRGNETTATTTSPEGTNYEAPYGRMGCDTPLTLFNSTLKAMKENSDGSSFLLISGDLAGHKLSEADTLKSIKEVSNQTRQTFPDIPVFPVFGNNDLPKNYQLPRSDEWYKKLLACWAPLIVCTGCPIEEADRPTTRAILEETFLDGGYYNASIASGRMVLLALNTVYWYSTTNYNNRVIKEVADRQMAWLRSQLEMAKTRGKKVFIMSHIHPGVNPMNRSFFWKENRSREYVNLVAVEYHDIIEGQFYGHIHKDDFNLQIVEPSTNSSTKSVTKSFILLNPAISTVYYNNPAFRVMSMDNQQLSLIDYDQYFLDLVMATEFSKPVWQFDYTFSKKYPSNITFINADRIDELNSQLINPDNGRFWHEYMFSRQVRYQPERLYSRVALYCGMRHVLEKDFKECMAKYKVQEVTTNCNCSCKP